MQSSLFLNNDVEYSDFTNLGEGAQMFQIPERE